MKFVEENVSMSLLRVAGLSLVLGLLWKAAPQSASLPTYWRYAHPDAKFLVGLDFAVGPAYEVVIAGQPDAEDTRALLRALNRAYVPNHVLLFRPEGTEPPRITELAPFTKQQTMREGKATAYVCQAGECKTPVTSADEMLKLLK